VQTINARLRVVVADRRRLVREGLTTVLRAVPRVEVVAAVAGTDELGDLVDPFDTVVTNLPRIELASTADIRVLTYIDTHTVDTLVTALCEEPQAAPVPVESPTGPRLTPREVQVMRGIADGLSTAQIAAALGIAPKSVDNHKQRIFGKLRVRSQAHAVAVSLAAGLLDGSVSTARELAGLACSARR
jgi:DNA-binding NarL/FixJ family response regulator